jgi:hypothetical protein
MLRRVALVRTDVSEKCIFYVIGVTKIGEVGATLVVNINRSTLLLVTAIVVPSSPILAAVLTEGIRSSETLGLARATWRNIPEDGILYSHHRENLKSYITLTGWVCSGEVMCLL